MSVSKKTSIGRLKANAGAENYISGNPHENLALTRNLVENALYEYLTDHVVSGETTILIVGGGPRNRKLIDTFGGDNVHVVRPEDNNLDPQEGVRSYDLPGRKTIKAGPETLGNFIANPVSTVVILLDVFVRDNRWTDFTTTALLSGVSVFATFRYHKTSTYIPPFERECSITMVEGVYARPVNGELKGRAMTIIDGNDKPYVDYVADLDNPRIVVTPKGSVYYLTPVSIEGRLGQYAVKFTLTTSGQTFAPAVATRGGLSIYEHPPLFGLSKEMFMVPTRTYDSMGIILNDYHTSNEARYSNRIIQKLATERHQWPPSLTAWNNLYGPSTTDGKIQLILNSAADTQSFIFERTLRRVLHATKAFSAFGKPSRWLKTIGTACAIIGVPFSIMLPFFALKGYHRLQALRAPATAVQLFRNSASEVAVLKQSMKYLFPAQLLTMAIIHSTQYMAWSSRLPLTFYTKGPVGIAFLAAKSPTTKVLLELLWWFGNRAVGKGQVKSKHLAIVWGAISFVLWSRIGESRQVQYAVSSSSNLELYGAGAHSELAIGEKFRLETYRLADKAKSWFSRPDRSEQPIHPTSKSGARVTAVAVLAVAPGLLSVLPCDSVETAVTTRWPEQDKNLTRKAEELVGACLDNVIEMFEMDDYVQSECPPQLEGIDNPASAWSVHAALLARISKFPGPKKVLYLEQLYGLTGDVENDHRHIFQMMASVVRESGAANVTPDLLQLRGSAFTKCEWEYKLGNKFGSYAYFEDAYDAWSKVKSRAICNPPLMMNAMVPVTTMYGALTNPEHAHDTGMLTSAGKTPAQIGLQITLIGSEANTISANQDGAMLATQMYDEIGFVAKAKEVDVFTASFCSKMLYPVLTPDGHPSLTMGTTAARSLYRLFHLRLQQDSDVDGATLTALQNKLPSLESASKLTPVHSIVHKLAKAMAQQLLDAGITPVEEIGMSEKSRARILGFSMDNEGEVGDERYMETFFRTRYGRPSGEVINAIQDLIDNLAIVGEPLTDPNTGSTSRIRQLDLTQFPVVMDFVLTEFIGEADPLVPNLGTTDGYEALLVASKDPSLFQRRQRENERGLAYHGRRKLIDLQTMILLALLEKAKTLEAENVKLFVFGSGGRDTSKSKKQAQVYDGSGYSLAVACCRVMEDYNLQGVELTIYTLDPALEPCILAPSADKPKYTYLHKVANRNLKDGREYSIKKHRIGWSDADWSEKIVRVHCSEEDFEAKLQLACEEREGVLTDDYPVGVFYDIPRLAKYSENKKLQDLVDILVDTVDLTVRKMHRGQVYAPATCTEDGWEINEPRFKCSYSQLPRDPMNIVLPNAKLSGSEFFGCANGAITEREIVDCDFSDLKRIRVNLLASAWMYENKKMARAYFSSEQTDYVLSLKGVDHVFHEKFCEIDYSVMPLPFLRLKGVESDLSSADAGWRKKATAIYRTKTSDLFKGTAYYSSMIEYARMIDSMPFHCRQGTFTPGAGVVSGEPATWLRHTMLNLGFLTEVGRRLLDCTEQVRRANTLSIASGDDALLMWAGPAQRVNGHRE